MLKIVRRTEGPDRRSADDINQMSLHKTFFDSLSSLIEKELNCEILTKIGTEPGFFFAYSFSPRIDIILHSGAVYSSLQVFRTHVDNRWMEKVSLYIFYSVAILLVFFSIGRTILLKTNSEETTPP